jgi:ubiquitin conjugation factor E4 B
MSGFLPDLASWALRGGAGNNNNDNNNEEDANNNDGGTPPQAEQLTEQEVRARRLARMEAMMAQQQEQVAAGDAMEVDIPTTNAASATTPMDISTSSSPPRKKPTSNTTTNNKKSFSAPTKQPNEAQQQKKKAKESHLATPLDASRKLQRKKELLIKKILSITLTPASDPACVALELDDIASIGVQSVAELLATRLSLPKSALNTMPPQKPLIPYLAHCHRKASDELKTMRQVSSMKSSSKNTDTSDMIELLEEMQRQVVSYAASSLMEPDLFEQASDGATQLSKALLNTTSDPTHSITFGVAGTSSSFYYMMCEELVTQDQETLTKVMAHVATQLLLQLKQCDSIDAGVGDTSALGLLSALTSLCGHKKAALAVTQMEAFLLPPKDSPQALELIRPPMPAGADLLRLLAGGDHRPYLKRSGPALEKETLLGAVFRVSSPKNNAAFSPTSILRQSLDSVERATNHQRQQLRVYQDACNQFILSLIKAGPDARQRVLQWVTDCLLVNPGATAMRPDATKVSSSAMLLNVSVVLLKLCEPFLLDEKKHHLIGAGFVSSPAHHGGVFPTSGDDALPRLGEAIETDTDDTSTPEEVYAPKNAFIPQCFFFAARSLALGIVPMLSHHENLLRHISHQHWELSSQHRDIHSDPHFCLLVSKQRSMEVALFQEEMVVDTLRFCNVMAKWLCSLEDTQLRSMPEHFVDNTCDILMGVAKMKAKLLRGMELRHVFSLVVKLLSPTYASVSIYSILWTDEPCIYHCWQN